MYELTDQLASHLAPAANDKEDMLVEINIVPEIKFGDFGSPSSDAILEKVASSAELSNLPDNNTVAEKPADVSRQRESDGDKIRRPRDELKRGARPPPSNSRSSEGRVKKTPKSTPPASGDAATPVVPAALVTASVTVAGAEGRNKADPWGIKKEPAVAPAVRSAPSDHTQTARPDGRESGAGRGGDKSAGRRDRGSGAGRGERRERPPASAPANTSNTAAAGSGGGVGVGAREGASSGGRGRGSPASGGGGGRGESSAEKGGRGKAPRPSTGVAVSTSA